MQAVEAMHLLIAECEANARHCHELMTNPNFADTVSDTEWREKVEQRDIALAVVAAMMNTALPVARFRCFVRLESGPESGREFTVCSVHIEDIVAALTPLSSIQRKVYIALWEQRPTGADMIEGYQGMTRAGGKPRLRLFLETLQKYRVLAN